MTGHLVLSTIHTNDALGVLSRLQSLKIPSDELANVINAVIAQRLVRCLCPHCKKEMEIPSEMSKFIKPSLNYFPNYKNLVSHSARNKKPLKIYQAQGCVQCDFTGYKGQSGIFEILIPPAKTKDLTKVKFPKLINDAVIKVLQGITSWEEIKRVLGI